MTIINQATEIEQQQRSLSLRLKHETAAYHERMHHLMAQAQVFASRERYAQFTLAQYYFQRNVEQLFKDPQVEQLIPDLDVRGRSDAALADLNDLGIQPTISGLVTEQVVLPAALGWIYVSEGSTLGAAFLFKEAKAHLGLSEEYGARNLAAYPEGRAKVWKRFVAAMDDANYDSQQQDQVIEGAKAAFAFFGELLEQLDTLQ